MRPTRPVLCLVTDRQRLPEPVLERVVSLARAAAAAGVDLIQVREPDLESRALFELACRIVEAASGTPAAVVINDRVDVAIAARADGVHLRAASVPVERVRAIAPEGFLVGRSVHGAAEAVEAEADGADYVVMGTIYPSRSKPGLAAPAGTAALSVVCRAVQVPVLAIGGITADRALEVAGAGAAGIAGIGVFSDTFGSGDGQAVARLAALVETVTGAFAGV